MTKQEMANLPVLCYTNHVSQTSKLSSTARLILDAVLILMDVDNNILFDKQNIGYINQILNKNGKAFTIPTIKNAISELFKVELILRAKNSCYVVNPQYFIKFDINVHRQKMIEYLYSYGVYDRTINARAANSCRDIDD